MSSYQPYAPTPPSYLPRPLAASTLNLDAEAKLWTTPAQRELYESLAELHAIIVSLEFLEKAFVRDSIPAAAYTPTCARLLGQYRTLLGNESVHAAFGNLDAFMRRYGIECPAATRRIVTGMPATVEHPESSSSAVPLSSSPASGGDGGGGGGGGGGGEGSSLLQPSNNPGAGGSSGVGGGGGGWKGVSPKAAAEATQDFITAMDALRLNYRAKDELHPLLANVITSVDAVTGVGGEFDGRKDIVKWLIVLNGMRPEDEIDESQNREILWDLERGYNRFLEGLG